MPIGKSPFQGDNRLLRLLPAEAQSDLSKRATRVGLESRREVYWPGEPPQHLYFPINCVVSLVVTTTLGETVEFGTVGREGFVGLQAVLGGGSMPSRAFCQVPGDAWRIPSGAFGEVLGRHPETRLPLQRYVQGVFSQAAQSAACNRVHSISQRCARWLLLVHDRVDGDRLSLTHEYISQMLGVRRASVSEVMQTLERQGIVENGRGRVAVRDRDALERTACECYATIRQEMDRLVPLPASEPNA